MRVTVHRLLAIFVWFAVGSSAALTAQAPVAEAPGLGPESETVSAGPTELERNKELARGF